MDNKYYSKYPLHVYPHEYKKWREILSSNDELVCRKEQKEELLTILENSEFWYKKYKHLTESFNNFMTNEGIEVTLIE